jgi:hypothetical protein
VYGNSETDENIRLVEIALEVFDTFIYTASSCRMFCKLPLIKQLVQNHLMQFNILSGDTNFKHLGIFYKNLTCLWLNDEFVEHFDTYIS